MSRRTSASARRGSSARQRSRDSSEIRGREIASTPGRARAGPASASSPEARARSRRSARGDRCRHTAASASGWWCGQQLDRGRLGETVDEVRGLRWILARNAGYSASIARVRGVVHVPLPLPVVARSDRRCYGQQAAGPDSERARRPPPSRDRRCSDPVTCDLSGTPCASRRRRSRRCTPRRDSATGASLCPVPKRRAPARSRAARGPTSLGGLEDSVTLFYGSRLAEREATHGAAQPARPVEHVNARLRGLLAARDAVARLAGGAVVGQSQDARLIQAPTVWGVAQQQLEAMAHCGPSEHSTFSRSSVGSRAAPPAASRLPSRSNISAASAGGCGSTQRAAQAGSMWPTTGAAVARRPRSTQRSLVPQSSTRVGARRSEMSGKKAATSPRGRHLLISTNGSALKFCPGTETSPLGLDEHAAVDDLDDAPPERADLHEVAGCVCLRA